MRAGRHVHLLAAALLLQNRALVVALAARLAAALLGEGGRAGGTKHGDVWSDDGDGRPDRLAGEGGGGALRTVDGRGLSRRRRRPAVSLG